jgi:hypothetical protein
VLGLGLVQGPKEQRLFWQLGGQKDCLWLLLFLRSLLLLVVWLLSL